ncbi:MAG: peptidylprolyl isomerase [Acidobacteriia bacterium]|nr:peptidylprolyl isomerase [Terriglobia bacterium]
MKRVAASLALGLSLWVAGCGEAPTAPGPSTPLPPQTVIARIGDENYTHGQFREFLAERFPESSNPIPSNNKVLSALLDEALNDRLVLKEAVRQGITVSAKEVQEYLQNTSLTSPKSEIHPGSTPPSTPEQRARDILLTEKYLNLLLATVPPISKADERRYYETHGAEFQEPERYHIEEILVKNEPLAEAVLQMLAKRKSFESLAQKYSENSMAKRGGDLGWFARGELPEQLEKAVWGLKPGAHSQIVKTDYGFHIFKVKEIRAGYQLSFDAARPGIQTALGQEHKNEILAQTIERLRKETPPTIEVQKLDFKYISEK